MDLYVSYEAQPSVGGPTPLARASARTSAAAPSVYMVDGPTARPYGVYSFTVTAKRAAGGEAAGPPGRSFSGVVRGSSEGGDRLSIYENDVSPSSSARLTVRNVSTVAAEWRIAPEGSGPAADERSGVLAAGEAQIARDVTADAYVIEFLVGGERVAMVPRLELSPGRNTIVYLVGEAQPAADREQLTPPVAVQELAFAPGPADPHVTTTPSPPVSAADEPAAIVLNGGSAASWEQRGETTVSAFDPDRVVDNLSIDGVLPGVGDVELRSLVPSGAAGTPAAAQLSLKADVPDGAYRLALAATGDASGDGAGCTMRLKVKPITIERVRDRVLAYRASGDVEAATGEDVVELLDRADAHMADGEIGGACVDLNELLNTIRAQKGRGMSDAAADALIGGLRELRADLGC